ncbi:LysR family transcriptional regulator [Acetobacter fabarum]|uniref:LysR family transcriptional regulator n=1 Tax=Acetobacter fabarum TaxID=483199 RepID=UPI0020A1C9A8|nr:LysR family transcriptional regulator [Acetobacter fabarum]MCP1228912.1 LysR family transcriptional regulator [Acetobacter fabarum]MCP1234407.1 LysR family transcriptional regulator [Acetobacter fabarum]
MLRENTNDLLAFMAVARERSFTRAAAKLGVSRSALSHTIRNLEERLGLRLLARTTRSVGLTEAGARLLDTIRLTATEHPTYTILWPRVSELLRQYPDIKVEIVVDYGLRDIVVERFDAGVRVGESIARDMIVVPISPALRSAVVCSPAYLARHGVPATPQDLTTHACINMRLPTHDTIFEWEFEKRGQSLNMRVDGPAVVNTLALRLNAALDGVGLAYMPEDYAMPHIEAGRLVRVLEDWCDPYPGCHLFYPSRRQMTPAFALLVEALRYRA